MATALPARVASSAASNAVIGTALYVGTAAMLFGGLISAAMVLRAGATWSPVGSPRLPVAVSAANLLVLMASGVLVWRAVRARRLGGGRRELAAGGVLGTVFFCVQGVEWAVLLTRGLRLSSGPYGAVFYTLVGAHAIHVIGGLTALWITLSRLRQGAGDVAACSLYWGFVVLLWPVLYVLVY